MTDWRERAYSDCYQDSCENCPFASVGGLEQRANMQLPTWVPQEDWHVYLAGYQDAALKLYGADWQTCEFSWKPALVIPGDEQAVRDSLVITDVRDNPDGTITVTNGDGTETTLLKAEEPPP